MREPLVVSVPDINVVPEPIERRPVHDLLIACRPRQWSKNLLVIAAPGAAGVLADPAVALRVIGAFVALTLCASATYLVNDAVDARWDAQHPVKRLRPVASGAVSIRAAVLAAVILGASGSAVAAAIGPAFLLLILGYLALTLAYSFALKRVEVVELGVVAGGFVLRAVAGGVATHVTPSPWFLALVSCASVLMVTGKRVVDARFFMQTGSSDHTRNTVYPLEFLQGLWVLAAGGAITAYCLWAIRMPHVVDGVSWSRISIVPFGLAIMKYALVVQEGGGAAPENVLLHDRVLQALSLVWIVTYAIGVYGR